MDASPRRTAVIGLALSAAVVCCTAWYLWPEPNINRARQHVDIGDLAAARTELEGFLQQHPTDSSALLMLGDVFRSQGDRPRASQCYSRVMPDSFEFQQASTNRTKVLLELSDLSGAEAQMVRHLQEFADERVIWDELRWLCFNQFRTRDVDELSHWWLKNHPDDTQALVHLLLGVFRPQVPQEGSVYLQQALDQIPDQVTVMRALAWAAWQSGRADESRQLLKEAWQIAPETPRTRLLAAEILIEEHDLEAAAKTLGDQPIEITGDVFGRQADRWHWLRSRMLLAQNQLGDALKHVDQALEYDSANLEYIHARGLILRQLGREAEAQEASARARTIEMCKKRFAEIAFSGVWERPSPQLCAEVAKLYEQWGDDLVAKSWRRWGRTMQSGHARPAP